MALKMLERNKKREIPPEEQSKESGRDDNRLKAEEVSESVHGKTRHTSLNPPVDEHH
jgi:hypothetical protein